ncbi:MAG: hypothetical protein IBX72_06215 [Nitrospirae bacterium]|nr:hypothetical protein [Nitrospirota bacterium]
MLWLKIHLMEIITDTVQLEIVHKFIIRIMTVGLKEIQTPEGSLTRKRIRIRFKGVRKEK